MRVLVIGGTGFIGGPVVRHLLDAGHVLALFHRREPAAETERVTHLLGDRRDLPAFAGEFRRFAPEVVLDTIPYLEREAVALQRTFRGVARRVVVLSSQDVYAAYGRFRRIESGAPNPERFDEEAPLRSRLYPYRGLARGPEDLAHDYEKILVERVVTGEPELPGTVLRLPQVHGPGDPHHRTWEYLKRMDDRRPAILLDAGRAGWRWTRGHVDNVAAAIALTVTDARATGRVYNLGEERALTEAEWVERIGEAAGWSGKVVALPAGRLPPHLVGPYDWRHDLAADTRRIRSELGYAEAVPFLEGLRRTVAWERAHPPEQISTGRFDYPSEDAALAARA